MEKKYYTEEVFKEKYKMSPQNFILHKTLLGDNSDKIKGVKGLGEKGLLKKFPELSERNLTFDDIFEICEKKFKDHVVYARIIQGVDDLEKNYKVMDLSNPMIDENEKKYLDEVVKSKEGDTDINQDGDYYDITTQTILTYTASYELGSFSSSGPISILNDFDIEIKNESILSNIPPCPGIKLLESFTSACLL